MSRGVWRCHYCRACCGACCGARVCACVGCQVACPCCRAACCHVYTHAQGRLTTHACTHLGNTHMHTHAHTSTHRAISTASSMSQSAFLRNCTASCCAARGGRPCSKHEEANMRRGAAAGSLARPQAALASTHACTAGRAARHTGLSPSPTPRPTDHVPAGPYMYVCVCVCVCVYVYIYICVCVSRSLTCWEMRASSTTASIFMRMPRDRIFSCFCSNVSFGGTATCSRPHAHAHTLTHVSNTSGSKWRNAWRGRPRRNDLQASQAACQSGAPCDL